MATPRRASRFAGRDPNAPLHQPHGQPDSQGKHVEAGALLLPAFARPNFRPDKAEPGKGYDAQATEWKAKAEALSSDAGQGIIRSLMRSDVTQILAAIDNGDPGASEALLPLVYEELRQLAAQRMANEAAGQTLQATALVHEAYLRLVGSQDGRAGQWDGRAHFFSAAAAAMRRILIDRARAKGALKRGGHPHRLRLDQDPLAGDPGGPGAELLDLDDALTKLAAEDPTKVELVQLRFFAGLTLEEAAGMLGISPATADRHWSYARAWLYHEMSRR